MSWRPSYHLWASQVALVVKYPPANAGDERNAGSIPRSGRSPGEGHGNPLQYSCLENPMDRGGWWATVHGVAKSQTWLKLLSMPAHRGQIPWRRTHRTQGWERSLGWLIKSRDEAAISLWRAGLDQESGPDYLPCCLWSSVQMRAPNSLTPLTQENLCPTPWWGCGGWWGRRVELCLAARLSW